MPPREGIGHHILYLSRFLRDHGCEITIVTRRRANEIEVDEFEGIAVYRVMAPFLPPFHLYLHSFFLRPLVSKLTSEVDLFHIHHPLVPVLHFNRPVVTTVHSSLIEDIKHYESRTFRNNVKAILTRTYYRSIIQRYLERSDTVITVSPSVLNELHKYYHPSDKTIEVIPNGIDTDFFSPGLPHNNQRVLFVGRLGERKGVDDFIAAAELIGRERRNVEFFIVGEGPLRSQLERKSASSLIAQQIHFVGWKSRTEIRELYRSSAVFVFPSWYEAAPLTLLEAMACGLPIVSTPVGNAHELIQHNRNGLLVQVGKPEQIAEQVILLLQNEKFRNELGKQARATVERQYSVGESCRRTLDVYTQVLSKAM